MWPVSRRLPLQPTFSSVNFKRDPPVETVSFLKPSDSSPLQLGRHESVLAISQPRLRTTVYLYIYLTVRVVLRKPYRTWNKTKQTNVSYRYDKQLGLYRNISPGQRSLVTTDHCAGTAIHQLGTFGCVYSPPLAARCQPHLPLNSSLLPLERVRWAIPSPGQI